MPLVPSVYAPSSSYQALRAKLLLEDDRPLPFPSAISSRYPAYTLTKTQQQNTTQANRQDDDSDDEKSYNSIISELSDRSYDEDRKKSRYDRNSRASSLYGNRYSTNEDRYKTSNDRRYLTNDYRSSSLYNDRKPYDSLRKNYENKESSSLRNSVCRENSIDRQPNGYSRYDYGKSSQNYDRGRFSVDRQSPKHETNKMTSIDENLERKDPNEYSRYDCGKSSQNYDRGRFSVDRQSPKRETKKMTSIDEKLERKDPENEYSRRDYQNYHRERFSVDRQSPKREARKITSSIDEKSERNNIKRSPSIEERKTATYEKYESKITPKEESTITEKIGSIKRRVDEIKQSDNGNKQKSPSLEKEKIERTSSSSKLKYKKERSPIAEKNGFVNQNQEEDKVGKSSVTKTGKLKNSSLDKDKKVIKKSSSKDAFKVKKEESDVSKKLSKRRSPSDDEDDVVEELHIERSPSIEIIPLSPMIREGLVKSRSKSSIERNEREESPESKLTLQERINQKCMNIERNARLSLSKERTLNKAASFDEDVMNRRGRTLERERGRNPVGRLSTVDDASMERLLMLRAKSLQRSFTFDETVKNTPPTQTNQTLDTINEKSNSRLSTFENRPPQIPFTRRPPPVRRSTSVGLDDRYERYPDGRVKPLVFQPRPLKNLTVVTKELNPDLPNVNVGNNFGNFSRSSSVSRCYSPAPSIHSRTSRSTTPRPRRIFPQSSQKALNDEFDKREESPVVFDANLTFVLGCKTKMKPTLQPIPAFLEDATASSYLSNKIQDFLQRTDHVMDEWKQLGKNEGEDTSYRAKRLGRSKSANNILIKGFQLYSRASSVSRSSVTRDLSEDRTIAEVPELSEMTADLAEEHSTSTLAAERLDAETSERIRLERELNELQHKNKTLSQASERLEMELIYAKSELNGISEDEGEGDEDGGVYKQRYERAVRELEFTKRRLQQQHEDDLEQLVALKKQLEKKLTDAYEDVDEQRQVVGQWKRKVQKLNSETNDLRLLLEEQTARNNLLEKKQRKFDSETQLLHDELRQEKQNKDRILREKELLNSEKFSLESSLADTRMELEMKEEKLAALQREFDEVTYGGKTEEEVTLLRKQKIDLDRRCHDQEEELDELAGQVQLLEQAKLKLEMSLEQQRKASKKEAQQHDEELEEVRCNAQKKVKALEAQLESEHEERTLLLREKHELERRLAAVAESDRNEKACDEALLHRLKRDLKRTKILLKDTQAQLERQKAENPNKNLIRQLRNQLEDAECARAIALKAKQTLEADLNETQSALDEANKFRSEAEERCNALSREKTDLQAQVEEGEEELAEVLKKYKGAVQQMSMDQMALQEQVSLVAELEVERNQLKDQLNELTSRLESAESLGDASSNLMLKRTELKVKELESKLELEQTTRGRLDVQIARLKEALDKLQTEFAAARAKEQQAQDQARKLQRSLREAKEELSKSQAKEAESMQKRKELEKKCESFETEAAAARTDLRLALKRIEDLQSAIQGELEDTSTEHSDSEQDSYSSDESVSTFLANHKVGSKMDRSPTSENSHKLTSTSRSSTSSTLTKDSSYT